VIGLTAYMNDLKLVALKFFMESGTMIPMGNTTTSTSNLSALFDVPLAGFQAGQTPTGDIFAL